MNAWICLCISHILSELTFEKVVQATAAIELGADWLRTVGMCMCMCMAVLVFAVVRALLVLSHFLALASLDKLQVELCIVRARDQRSKPLCLEIARSR